MNNTCIHCGISTPFYESGFIVARSSQTHLLESHSPIRLEGRTAVFEYGDLEEAELKVTALTDSNFKDLRLGLSDAPNTSPRFYDAGQLKERLTERETVEFIQNGSMTSYLQPIVDMKSQVLHGYEALLRAKNPEEFIPPAHLFGVAASTGLSSLLDQRAREAAVNSRGGIVPPGIKSFINFLPSTIYNPDFCLKHTFEIVEKHGVNPEDLVFEVVETEKIEDVGHLKTVLDRYRKEGMKVALDDLGAGFATIEMLELLQPDYVKIDRWFVTDCHLDAEKQKFLLETAKRARQLGILTLAEGIEKEEEFQLCKQMGYDFAQGYFIGKPKVASLYSRKVV